jgi:hypothetical protein
MTAAFGCGRCHRSGRLLPNVAPTTHAEPTFEAHALSRPTSQTCPATSTRVEPGAKQRDPSVRYCVGKWELHESRTDVHLRAGTKLIAVTRARPWKMALAVPCRWSMSKRLRGVELTVLQTCVTLKAEFLLISIPLGFTRNASVWLLPNLIGCKLRPSLVL